MKKIIGKAFVGIDVQKSNWKVCVLGELIPIKFGTKPIKHLSGFENLTGV